MLVIVICRAAVKTVEALLNLFGEGNFYLEMQPSKDKEQIYVNKKT